MCSTTKDRPSSPRWARKPDQHHDVTVEDDWVAAVAKAESCFGPVKHLVNNAGIVTFGAIESTAPAEFRRTIDINLTGCWLGMHFTVPSIRRAGGGSIVNIASTAALQGYANLGSYVASKWGMRGLTKAAALELGPLGIRVNSIHPGPIRTPMIAGLDADSIAATQPIARVGEPEEVTAMLLFLLADATYSTGHEFIIDGGAVIGQVVKTSAQSLSAAMRQSGDLLKLTGRTPPGRQRELAPLETRPIFEAEQHDDRRIRDTQVIARGETKRKYLPSTTKGTGDFDEAHLGRALRALSEIDGFRFRILGLVCLGKIGRDIEN